MNPSITLSRPEPYTESDAPLLLHLASAVNAGFPSPAEEYLEPTVDIAKHLVPRPSSTFLARVKGHSMKDDGINDGDLLVIDRSVKPTHGKTAVCFLDGEFTLKRLHVSKQGVKLVPANSAFPVIPITPENQFTVWGVVTWVVHKA